MTGCGSPRAEETPAAEPVVAVPPVSVLVVGGAQLQATTEDTVHKSLKERPSPNPCALDPDGLEFGRAPLIGGDRMRDEGA